MHMSVPPLQLEVSKCHSSSAPKHFGQVRKVPERVDLFKGSIGDWLSTGPTTYTLT